MARDRTDRVRVSDHALVRFLERTGALDAEALRASIEDSLQRAVDRACVLRASQFEIVADGLRYVVRGTSVVTVLVDYGPGVKAPQIAKAK